MKSLIRSSLILALCAGCSGSVFDSKEAPKKNETAHAETTKDEDDFLTEQATIPVAIGGAPLLCGLNKTSNIVSCQTFDGDGKPMDYNPDFAYIISGKIPVQTQVPLKKTGLGEFAFVLPSEIRSLEAFGVGLGSSSADILLTMVGYGDTDLENIVRDPSFENVVIPVDKFIPTSEYKSWQGNTRVATNCVDLNAIMEQQKTGALGKGFDGAQWADLDSHCTSDPKGTGGNILLYQDLAVQQDHMYSISFAQKRNKNNSTSKLIVRWGGEVLLEQETTADNWVVLTTMKPAKSSSARIEFEEIGLEDALGTLIDDVRIYDMGLPLPPK